MMNSEIQASAIPKFSILIEVNGEDISMKVDSNENNVLDPLEVQRALLYLCIQIGSQLNEKWNQGRPR